MPDATRDKFTPGPQERGGATDHVHTYQCVDLSCNLYSQERGGATGDLEHVQALLSTPAPFKRWLQEQARSYAMVGTGGNPCGCPIYSWLMDSGLRGHYVSVGKGDLEFETGGKLHRLVSPAWITLLVGVIDCAFPQKKVLADEALIVLAQVEEAA